MPTLPLERGFLTTKGTPIVKGPLMEALQLPTEVAIIYCHGSPDLYAVTLGSVRVDLVAWGLASTSSRPTEHILFLTSSYKPQYQPERGKNPNSSAKRPRRQKIDGFT